MAYERRGGSRLAAFLLALGSSGLAVLAGYAFYREYSILKTWPVVQAEVVSSKLHDFRARRGGVTYDVLVYFRFTVGAEPHMTYRRSNHFSSDPAKMQPLLAKYAKGTRHPIRYNPSNPRQIDFDTAYDFDTFVVTFIAGGFSLLFFAFGIYEWVTRRT